MKAISLFSGGLDSSLAIKVIQDQGIDVEAVHFLTPFGSRKSRDNAKGLADALGVRFKVFETANDYIDMVKEPKHGYGKNINPCIDCKIFMYRYAKIYMNKSEASFLITGEVLGQRPMSQYKRVLANMEKESEMEGLVVRPLSATVLPATIPEKEGWIKRERMFGFSGRSRKPQIALAKHYNITKYGTPAGGCLLTDISFTGKLRDTIKHSECTPHDVELLRVGKHFRLSDNAKLIVGRNKEENEKLLKMAKEGDIYFTPVGVKGPVGTGRGKFDKEVLMLACRIIARYSDGDKDAKVKIAVDNYPSGNTDTLAVGRMQDQLLCKFRI
ncbi:MAG: 7-cyano-7-deazaguanine synthase [bacterium]